MDHIWSLKCARNDHHISEDQEAATKCSKRMVKRRERIAMMRRLRRRERNFGPQQQNLPKRGKKRRNLLHTVKTVQKRSLNT